MCHRVCGARLLGTWVAAGLFVSALESMLGRTQSLEWKRLVSIQECCWRRRNTERREMADVLSFL